MARSVNVAAAQLGAIPEGTSREEMVDRMLVLLEQAVEQRSRSSRIRSWRSRRTSPSASATTTTSSSRPRCRPRPRPAAAARGAGGVACHIGFAEKAGGKYFNTAHPHGRGGALGGTYRKIHLPGRHQARRPRAGLRAVLLRGGRHGLPGLSDPQGQGRHRDVPGPAVSRVVPVPRHPRGRDRSHRLQHAALAAGPRPQRARACARARTRTISSSSAWPRRGSRTVSSSSRAAASSIPGAGDRQGGHDRRRAGDGPPRPGPDATRPEALELSRPPPPGTLWPDDEGGPPGDETRDGPAKVDTIVRGGRVVTPAGVDDTLAIAIGGGRIVAMGGTRSCCPRRPHDRRRRQDRAAGRHRLPRAPRRRVRRLGRGPLAAAHAGLTTLIAFALYDDARPRRCPRRSIASARRSRPSPCSTSGSTTSSTTSPTSSTASPRPSAWA